MTEPRLSFRRLQRSEALQLGRINRACPIEADFTIVFERGDNFLGWPDLLYDSYQYVGAFCGGEIVGYAMLGLFKGWTGEGFGTCGYLGDVRLLPGFRGGHLAGSMLRALRASIPPGFGPGFFVIKKGNVVGGSLPTGVRFAPYEVHLRGDLRVFNIPFLRFPAVSPQLTVRPAQPRDAGSMSVLFAKANAGKLFAPPISEERIRDECSQWPAIGLGRYWLAESAGRVLGMLAAWDLQPWHSACVLRYSLSGMLLRTAYNLAPLFVGRGTRLPKAGGVLKTLTITRVAIHDDDPAILRALLSRVMREYLADQYHALTLGFVEGDPLIDCTRGFSLVQRFPSSFYVIAPTSPPIRDRWRRVYVDLAMI